MQITLRLGVPAKTNHYAMTKTKMVMQMHRERAVEHDVVEPKDNQQGAGPSDG